MLARQDLVAALHDQLMDVSGKPSVGVIDAGGGLLELEGCSDHFGWNQLLADAEVFQRPLGLGSPQPVCRNGDRAEAVGFVAHVRHQDHQGYPLLF